jgi:hypothetical protein
MAKMKKSPVWLVLLAWIVVSVPAGWGVYNTTRNALKLFQSAPPPTTGK